MGYLVWKKSSRECEGREGARKHERRKKKTICRLYCQKIGIPFIQWRKENFESHPDRKPVPNQICMLLFQHFFKLVLISPPGGATITSVIAHPFCRNVVVCFSVKKVQLKTLISASLGPFLSYPNEIRTSQSGAMQSFESPLNSHNSLFFL